jgi:hypothetical protein
MATLVIVGWFAGLKWANNSKWYVLLSTLLCIFVVHTQFTGVLADCTIQPGGLRFGDSLHKMKQLKTVKNAWSYIHTPHMPS